MSGARWCMSKAPAQRLPGTPYSVCLSPGHPRRMRVTALNSQAVGATQCLHHPYMTRMRRATLRPG